MTNSSNVYLEVLVAGASFHGDRPLTYSHTNILPVGTIVIAPLRSQLALGVVIRQVTKPEFVTKPLADVPDLPTLPANLVKLLFWMQNYYPGPLGITTSLFLPKKLPSKPVEQRPPGPAPSKRPLPLLTEDQQKALSTINGAGTYILHGDTGTGKTRVYIELAKISLAKGLHAIILTPEIGLTSQLANDFREVFGERVVVIHSQLTEVTRRRLWVSLLRQQQPMVILGPRSALFSPLKTVGLIVVDEAHDTAYKQDQAPYYQTVRVAAHLAALNMAPLVLGSATPLVSDYYVAKAKKRTIIRMQQTAVKGASGRATISVVDLKDRSKFTKKPQLSDELLTAIGGTLQKKEQTLLFLNRRGTARIVFCTDCGWQATCPRCDLPLIYHGDSHIMRCHTCGFKDQVVVDCPECHNSSIVFKAIGTKAIVDEINKLFPDARVMRFDNDNKKDERMEHHYDTIKAGGIDIIIGTQSLAKGLDLPNLSLVGVVAADTGLSFPDFSAQERTYQLLSQVIGRVGRGHRHGTAIIQTYNPESPLLKAVISKNWADFYDQEISERQLFLFPPFCHLLKLTCRRATADSAAKTAKMLAGKLRTAGLRIQIEGPAPAFHEKAQNKYQWQLVVKAKARGELVKVIRGLPSGWSYDIDPTNLL
jgi:primosomal protein N' (replication factor Y)